MIEDYTQILNNRYLERLESSPIEVYNARSSEAIAMNSFELSSKLCPLELRKVNKGGQCWGDLFLSS